MTELGTELCKGKRSKQIYSDEVNTKKFTTSVSKYPSQP